MILQNRPDKSTKILKQSGWDNFLKKAKKLTTHLCLKQRQWRLQKERLHNDFTKALNSFQAAQRTAAQKEKETIKAAKREKGMGGLAGKILNYRRNKPQRSRLDLYD